MKTLPIGTEVGARRWPYSHAHPDCWGKPWKGIVIAQNDVRAWTNTLAFLGTPTQEDVDKHVAWCHSLNLLDPDNKVPVLWDFEDQQGRPYQQAYWETYGDGAHDVRPYAEDLANWEQERHAERVRTRTHLKAA